MSSLPGTQGSSSIGAARDASPAAPSSPARLVPPVPTRRERAVHRRQRVSALAAQHAGVVSRQMLREAGITDDEIRAEVAGGRWIPRGRRTLEISGVPVVHPTARLWWAVWEGGRDAVLDGAAALVAHGLEGFNLGVVHVAVPSTSRVPAGLDPAIRVTRRTTLVRAPGGGPPRVTAEVATIRAAHQAVSDRQASLLVVMAVQQGLVQRERLRETWAAVQRSTRRKVIGSVIRLAVGGAESLGELDLARACDRWGLPQPDRQVLRTTDRGRAFLDAFWEEAGVCVEVDGVHHHRGLVPVEDALRQNELALGANTTLRMPAIGLVVDEAAFMRQLGRALGREVREPRQ